MTQHETETVAAIRTYLASGLAVVPVPARSKAIVLEWAQWAQERPTLAQWREWWREAPGCNVAVVYAASEAPAGKQLVCVDTDSEAAEAWVAAQRPLPLTPTVRTVKGWHRYYWAPTGLAHAAATAATPEVRAGVHYTLLPPSVHPSGAQYEWVLGMAWGEVPVVDLPGWGVALMRRQERKPDPQGDAPETIPEGQRNERLFRRCAKWRAADVPPAELRTAAHAYNAARCVPPLPDREVDSLVDSVLRYAPGTTPEREGKGTPEAATPEPADPANEASLLEAAEAAVNAVGGYQPPAGLFRGARPIEEIAAEVITAVEERRLLPRRVYGMRSGWPTLDWFFGGFKWQGLMLLSGDSGSSKTTVARHFVYATADGLQRDRSDARVLVYILEGGREQFLRYYAGWRYGVPLAGTKPGSEDVLTDDLRERLVQAYADFSLLPIDLCDETREADRILFDIERRATEGPVEAVILDNLQLLEFGRGNQWDLSKRAAMRALDLSDRLQFPFMVLSQINRDGKAWKERGGPEWRNNATCVFYAERGELGCRKEDKSQSNVTRLMNLKARYEERCCAQLTLRGDFATGRLWEEVEWQRMQAAPVRGRDADDDPLR